MPSIPMPQRGRNLTSIILTGQNADTAGALTDAATPVAPVTLTAIIESTGVDWNVETEEINALNSVRQNEVGLSEGISFDIEIFKVNNGGDPSPLRQMFAAYDYLKATWVEGTGGSQKTHVLYGTRKGYRDGFRGRGKQIAALSLSPVDAGTATYSVS